MERTGIIYHIRYSFSDLSTMEGKRVVPKPLKMILEWDVAMTEKFVKLVDQNYGPLAKHKGRLRGLEVMFCFKR